MRIKKNILILILVIAFTVFFVIISFFTITTISDLTIIEKGNSKDNKNAWIIGFNPNAPLEEQEEIKIIVKEPMVWNLIEKDKTYFVTYIKTIDGSIFLSNIKNIMNND